MRVVKGLSRFTLAALIFALVGVGSVAQRGNSNNQSTPPKGKTTVKVGPRSQPPPDNRGNSNRRQ